MPFQNFEGPEEQTRVFMDAELDHERDEETKGFPQLLGLRIFFIQDFRHLLFPKSRVVEDLRLGVRLEFGQIQGNLVKRTKILILFFFQIFVELHTFSH